MSLYYSFIQYGKLETGTGLSNAVILACFASLCGASIYSIANSQIKMEFLNDTKS
jgi:hypothetical protein